MKKRLSLIAMVLTAAISSLQTVSASPVVSPSVYFTVDDIRVDVELIRSGVGWSFDSRAIDVRDGEGALRASVALQGFLDPDPSISFALSVIDFGTPTTFTFGFSTPIVPTGPLTTVSSSLMGELTEGDIEGVSISPIGSHILTSVVLTPSTTMGVDIGDAASFPSGVNPYGPFNTGPQNGPTGIWTGLFTTVSFLMSGNSDSVSLSGTARIDNRASRVPDAGPGFILSLGVLVSLAAAARWRRATP